MTLEQKFWSHVTKGDVCWNWDKPNVHGYGRFSLGGGKSMGAHRFAYQILVGPVPRNRVLDHLCRNKRCVNPEHLEIVTNRENVLRGIGPSAKNATKTYCDHGHEFTEENTVLDARGRRGCRTCNRDKAALHAAKQRERVGYPRSKHKGVLWSVGSGKWRAIIWVDGRRAQLGVFEDEDEAARMAAWGRANPAAIRARRLASGENRDGR